MTLLFRILVFIMHIYIVLITYVHADDSPIEIFLNQPNSLAEQFVMVSRKSTNQLLNYIKKRKELEAQSCNNKQHKSSNNIKNKEFYFIYDILSMKVYKGISPSNFFRYMMYGSPVTIEHQPLMQGAINLCKKYPRITIKDMLNASKCEQQTDKDVKAFMQYMANDIRVYYKMLNKKEGDENITNMGINRQSWLRSMCSNTSRGCKIG